MRSSQASQLRVEINPAMIVTLGLILALCACGTVFADRFSTLNNFLNIYRYSAALMFVSLGQSVVVLTGGIDLSIGSLISLAGVLTSGLINGDSTRVVPVLIGVLVLGALIGLVNGALATLLKIHPLIVTLGTSAVLQGAALQYTLTPIGSVPTEFDYLAFGDFLGIPVGPLFSTWLLAITALVLRFTRLGRQFYAVGGNPLSAKLIGLSVRRVALLAFAFSGFMAALSGIYLVSLLGTGNPIMGQGYELSSITPVVLGGTLLSGGKGGVWGTFFGVLLMAMLNNLLNFLSVSTFYQWVIQGVIILMAVSVFPQRREVAP
jgi:ribose transport system permease protein